MQPSFIVAIFAPEENTKDHLSIGDAKLQKEETSPIHAVFRKPSLIDALVHYIERADDLIKRFKLFNVYSFYGEGVAVYLFLLCFRPYCLCFCWSIVMLIEIRVCYLLYFSVSSNPRILLCVLNFMIALWQGAPQYANLLESLRRHGKFWEHLANAISNISSSEISLPTSLKEKDAFNLAYTFHCQSSILGIMAYELFLQRKLFHAESTVKDAAESKEKEQNVTRTEKSKATNLHDLKGIWSSLFNDSILKKLIKSYTSYGNNNDIYNGAKVSLMYFSLLN